jgi:hypothetical protein
MRKKTQAYNYVTNKMKYLLRFDRVLETSTTSGTEHSGRLIAVCGVIQRGLPILCASQRVEILQPALPFFSFCEE